MSKLGLKVVDMFLGEEMSGIIFNGEFLFLFERACTGIILVVLVTLFILEKPVKSPNELQQVTLKTMSNKDCNSEDKGYSPEQITKQMLCAESNQKDACQVSLHKTLH